jgi:hypothetical protein
MSLGDGYTVEEQVTGKAEQGGLQFDIFPFREKPPGNFIVHEQKNLFRCRKLTRHMTPEELHLPNGTLLGMFP